MGGALFCLLLVVFEVWNIDFLVQSFKFQKNGIYVRLESFAVNMSNAQPRPDCPRT